MCNEEYDRVNLKPSCNKFKSAHNFKIQILCEHNYNNIPTYLLLNLKITNKSVHTDDI